jgi:hypothetical protein
VSPPRIASAPPPLAEDGIPRKAFEKAYDSLDSTAHLPRSLYCPIRQTPMCDPVLLLADGFSYEREAIVRWLKEKRTSPITGRRIEDASVVPNHAFRNTIAELIPSA